MGRDAIFLTGPEFFHWKIKLANFTSQNFVKLSNSLKVAKYKGKEKVSPHFINSWFSNFCVVVIRGVIYIKKKIVSFHNPFTPISNLSFIYANLVLKFE